MKRLLFKKKKKKASAEIKKYDGIVDDVISGLANRISGNDSFCCLCLK